MRNFFTTTLYLVFFANLCFGQISPSNKIIYVDSTASGNGSSWTSATPNLADALKFATDNPATVEQILVAKGTYFPKYQAGNGTNSRDAAFVIPSGLKVIGGYDAKTGLKTDKLPILSGDLGNDTYTWNDAYHVVIIVNASPATVFEGFQVSKGNADGSGGSILLNGVTVPRDEGAGIFIKGLNSSNISTPILKNLIVSGNRSVTRGGGIGYSQNSGGKIINTLLSGNLSDKGGAINFWGSDVMALNVTAAGNYAYTRGGGFYVTRYSKIVIYNSIIYGNGSSLVVTDNLYNDDNATEANNPYASQANNISVGNSDIQSTGGSANWNNIYGANLGGNLDIDPMFVNFIPQITYNPVQNTNGDYRLKEGSPAINTGLSTYYSNNVPNFSSWTNETDLAHNIRLGYGQIDMGAYEIPSYDTVNISFLRRIGDTVAVQTIYKYTTATPIVLDSAGFNFIAWYADAALSVQWNFTTPIIRDTTLYAKFERKSFTVRFLDFVSGEELASNQNVFYHDYALIPSQPNKIGYNFLGWYKCLDSACSEMDRWFFNIATVTENTTLFGRFAKQSVNVNFIADDTVWQSLYVEYGSKIVEPNIPQKYGYVFKNWSDIDGNTWNFSNDSITDYPEFNLYSVWEKDSFDVMYHCGNNILTQKIAYLDRAKGIDYDSIGYHLVSWYSFDNQSNIDWNFSTKIISDTNLYSVWEGNNYKLFFCGNGGKVVDFSGAIFNLGDTSINVTYGMPVGELKSAVRNGYTFLKWNKNPDGSGNVVTTESIFDFSGNDTVYAVWLIDTFDVKFLGFDNEVVEIQYVIYEDFCTPAATPSHYGYIFDFWNYNFTTKITENTFIASVWKLDTFNVKIVVNIGDTIDIKVPYNQTFSLPVLIQTGYIPRLYADQTFTKIWKISTAITQDTMLFVKWTASQDTMYFNTNGGNFTTNIFSIEYLASDIARKNLTYGEPVGALPATAKQGYVLLGWNTNPDAFGMWETEDTIHRYFTGVDTLYAIWQLADFYVLLDANGGNEIVNDSILTHYDSIVYLPVPTRYGYIFNGWNESKNGTGVARDLTFVFDKENNLKLYAQWIVDTFNVVLICGNGDTLTQKTAYLSNVVVPIVYKTGYRGVRWFVTKYPLQTWSFNTAITQDTSISLEWSPNDYLLVFDANTGLITGGGLSSNANIASKTVTFDAPVGMMPEVEKTGWTFVCWNVVANLDGMALGNTYDENSIWQTDNNDTLYAVWKIDTNYVNYYDYLADTLMFRLAVLYGDTTTNILPAVRTGFTFSGWTASHLSTFVSNKAWNFATPITSDVNLYGYWLREPIAVKFILSDTSSLVEYVEYGSTAYLPELSRTGYSPRFYVEAAYINLWNWNIHLYNDTTLYVKWYPAVSKLYFSGNGGIFTGEAGYVFSYNDTSKFVIYDQTVGVTPAVRKQGSTLVGWNTQIDGLGDFINDATVWKGVANDTVFAIWEKSKYYIVLDANGGTVVTDTIETHFGEAVNLPLPTRYGYLFTEWNTNKDGYFSGHYNNSFEYPLLTNLKLYAQWVPDTFTVYTIVKLGDTVIDHVPYLHKLTAPEPDSVGYLPRCFADEAFTILWDWNTLIYQDTTLYFAWFPIDDTIFFSPNGGIYIDQAAGSVSFLDDYTAYKPIAYGVPLGIEPFPTRTGFVHTGWNELADGTGNNITQYTIVVEGQLPDTLFATWQLSYYPIVLDANGGHIVTDTIWTNYDSILNNLTAVPVREGYHFTRWNTSMSGNGYDYDQNTIYRLEEGITLYAQWALDTLTVTFVTNNPNNDTLFSYNLWGFSAKIPHNLARDGYTYQVWGDKAMTQPYVWATSLYRDTTLFVSWLPITYKIYFSAQGGIFNDDFHFVAGDTSLPAVFGLPINFMPTVLREGCFFVEWNTQKDAFGTTVKQGDIYTYSNNDTLYAIWAKEVTNTNDNGEGSLRNAIAFANTMHGGVVHFHQGNNSNWADSTIFLNSQIVDIQYNTKINAYGVKINASAYNGDIFVSNADLDLQKAHFSYSSKSAVKSNGNLTVKNCIFDNNFTAVNAQNGNVFIYLSTFYHNDTAIAFYGNNLIIEGNYFYGNTVQLRGSASVQQSSYNVYDISNPIFTSNDKYFNDEYLLDGNFTPTARGKIELKIVDIQKLNNRIIDDFYGHIRTSDTTIAGAVIAPFYVVTFVPQTLDENVYQSYEGGAVIGATAPIFYNTGYEFLGWSTTPNDLNHIWNVGTPITTDLTLYALWKYSIYSVEFREWNNGNVLSQPQNIIYGQLLSPPATPVRTGYVFNGWFSLQNGNKIAWQMSSSTVVSDTILYGEFIKDTASVYFLSDGAIFASQRTAFGEKVNEPIRPTKTGYTFRYWNYYDNYTDAFRAYNFGIDTINENDLPSMVLLATFTIDTFNVGYVVTVDTIWEQVTYGGHAVAHNIDSVGYRIAGWYTGNHIAWNFGTPITQDTVITAIWQARSYKLYFDFNGGVLVGNSIIFAEGDTNKTVTFDNIIGTLPNASKIGHKFKGWSLDNDNFLNEEQIWRIPNNDTAHAVFVLDTFNVVFLGKNADTLEIKRVVWMGITPYLSAPEIYGYTFANWLDESSQIWDFNTPILANRSIRASYVTNTYNVKVVVNEGDTLNFPTLYNSFCNIVLPDSTGYTPRVYTDKTFTLVWNSGTPITHDTLLYVQWNPIHDTLYFNALDGIFVNQSVSTVTFISDNFASKYMTYDIPVGVMPTPHKRGFNFTGWNTQTDALGTWYYENTVWTSLDADTLYAIYELATYTLTLNPNGLSGFTTTTLPVHIDSVVHLPTLSQYGYIFDKWNAAATGNGTTFVDGFAYPFESDYTLYAIFHRDTFQVGYVVEENDTLWENVEYQGIASGVNVQKTGYTLSNWVSKLNGQNVNWLFSTPIICDTLLYAVWTPNQYKLVFDANCGQFTGACVVFEGLDTSKTVTYGQPVGTLPRMIRDGYDFLGWNNQIDLDGNPLGEYYSDSTIFNKTSNDTVHAIWNRRIHFVNFIDGSDMFAEMIFENDTAVYMEPSPKENYTFLGWYTSALLSIGQIWDFSTPITQNMSLYAQWNPDSISVNYIIDLLDTLTVRIPKGNATAAYVPNIAKIGYVPKYYADITYTVLWNWNVAIYNDTNVYVKWEPNTYKLYFNANGGNFVNALFNQNDTSKFVTYNAPVGSLPKVERNAYHLLNWNFSPDGNSIVCTPETLWTSTFNDTIFAIWAIDSIPEPPITNPPYISGITINGAVLPNFDTATHAYNYSIPCGENYDLPIEIAVAEGDSTNEVRIWLDETIEYAGVPATIPTNLAFGNHLVNVQLYFRDTLVKSYEITVVKRYFSDLIVRYWNNILAVNHQILTNGGYNFTACQWFKNDELQVGKTNFHINLNDFVTRNGEYSVLLSTETSSIMTCPLVINDAGESKIMIYPNPATDELKVECGNLKVKEVEIFDISGKIVNSFQFSTLGSQLKLDVHQLKSGTYILKIADQSVNFIKK